MFENTSYADWMDVSSPKVQGTWNLARALQGHNLDFFVLLSSFTGVNGLQGQANYASANTFLDAFVQTRRSQGLPASVIGVAPVEDVGYLSEQAETRTKLHTLSTYFIREQGFLDGLEWQSRRPLQAQTPATTGLPFMAPQNRVPWKRDSRCAFYRNIRGNSAEQSPSGNPVDDGELNSDEAKFTTLGSAREGSPHMLVQDANIAELARQ
ncbi:Uu.00g031130.m01.CDS01 [Anthostomella pinea]|uniref:Uu.00g031130.m01.CDS01 n=1 Tax=Anthostomella pinea TaxID=933095 RepID=A0AAI8V9F8_9PEZI|nr:Uu.00g031130.m01.CDS01 [Anthostomella pinea]